MRSPSLVGRTVTILSTMIQEHDARLEALRAALIEGERSGASEPLDLDRFLEDSRGPRPE